MANFINQSNSIIIYYKDNNFQPIYKYLLVLKIVNFRVKNFKKNDSCVEGWQGERLVG